MGPALASLGTSPVSAGTTCVSLSASGSGATPNTGLTRMTSCIGSTVEIGALSLGAEQEVPVVGAFVLEALMVRQRNFQQHPSSRNLQWGS